MGPDRSASLKLLVCDLIDAGAAGGGFPSPTLQSHWDDLLAFLAARYDLRGAVPDQTRVLLVRNRLLASRGAALDRLDGLGTPGAGAPGDDYGLAVGLLIWLIRDCALPYDSTLSVQPATIAHLEAHRVWTQFRHLQGNSGPAPARR